MCWILDPTNPISIHLKTPILRLAKDLEYIKLIHLSDKSRLVETSMFDLFTIYIKRNDPFTVFDRVSHYGNHKIERGEQSLWIQMWSKYYQKEI